MSRLTSLMAPWLTPFLPFNFSPAPLTAPLVRARSCAPTGLPVIGFDSVQ